MSDVLRLILQDTGTVELLREGQTVWSSDADPDVLEQLGTDELEEDDIPDVLDYLVDRKFLTDQQADDVFDRDFPESLEDEDENEDALSVQDEELNG